MKTFLHTIILTISFQYCNAQTYDNFVNEGTNWVFYFNNITPRLVGHEIAGDTLIDNIKYNKFLENQIEFKLDYLYPPYEVISKSLIGVIREDTIAKQVYMRLYNNYDSLCQDPTNEFLLFDFNLEIGDSFTQSCFYEDECIAELNNADTLKVSVSNVIRKAYSFYGSLLIEGLGFQSYILDNHFGCAHTYTPYWLVYFCEENNCDFLSAIEDQNNDQIKIFPNPIGSNGIMNIEAKEPIHRISIFNSNGQMVKEIRNINTRKFEIEQIGLLSGHYYLKIYFKNGVMISKLIVI